MTNEEKFYQHAQDMDSCVETINLDCCFEDIRNRFMIDMFYKDIEVVFNFEDEKDDSVGWESIGAHLLSAYFPEKDLYFDRDNFHPKVINWIENHLVENYISVFILIDPLYSIF